MGDYAFACKYQGHQGPNYTCYCTKRSERFGDTVCAKPEPDPLEAVTRTVEEWHRMGSIAKTFTKSTEKFTKFQKDLPGSQIILQNASKYPR
jgi:K+/H+ antiporter YhaU regulatory subunit KhtT